MTLDKFSHVKGATNLALGAPRWPPPADVLEQVMAERQSELHQYSDTRGLPELRDAILAYHGLSDAPTVAMVTAGANQAFVNVALGILDPGDKVILVSPYYFSHLAAIQMASAQAVVTGYQPNTFLPDLDQIQDALETARAQDKPIKAVVVTSPNNPSGAVVPPHTMHALVELTAKQRAWLVLDETYEAVLHPEDPPPTPHHSPPTTPPPPTPHPTLLHVQVLRSPRLARRLSPLPTTP